LITIIYIYITVLMWEEPCHEKSPKKIKIQLLARTIGRSNPKTNGRIQQRPRDPKYERNYSTKYILVNYL
jgi:hypothetical protein